MRLTISLGLVAIAGCTTLGPVPTTTGISPMPAPREGAELQVGGLPGFYLSQSVTENPKGGAVRQASLVIDPAELLDAPGLILAARLGGPGEDPQLEPIVGYRQAFGATHGVAVAGFLFGAASSGESSFASIESKRGGIELATDVRLGPPSRWFEAHVLFGVSVTALAADGEYCLREDAPFGDDCDDPPMRLTRGHADGVFPAANAGVAVHLFRHRRGHVHGARAILLVGLGRMPHVVDGEEAGAVTHASIGFGVALAFGARASSR